MIDFTLQDSNYGSLRGKVQSGGVFATLRVDDEDHSAIAQLSKKQMRELARKLLTMSEEMCDDADK